MLQFTAAKAGAGFQFSNSDRQPPGRQSDSAIAIPADWLERTAAALGRSEADMHREVTTPSDCLTLLQQLGNRLPPAEQGYCRFLADQLAELTAPEFSRLMGFSAEVTSGCRSRSPRMSAEDLIMLATLDRAHETERTQGPLLGRQAGRDLFLTEKDFAQLRSLNSSSLRQRIEQRYGVSLVGPWTEIGLVEFERHLEEATRRVRLFAQRATIELYRDPPFAGQKFLYTFQRSDDFRVTPFSEENAFASYDHSSDTISIIEERMLSTPREGQVLATVDAGDDILAPLVYRNLSDFFVHLLVHETGHALTAQRQIAASVLLNLFGIELYPHVNLFTVENRRNAGPVRINPDATIFGIRTGGSIRYFTRWFMGTTRVEPMPQAESRFLKTLQQPDIPQSILAAEVTTLTDCVVGYRLTDRCAAEQGRWVESWELPVDIVAVWVAVPGLAAARAADDYSRDLLCFRMIWGK